MSASKIQSQISKFCSKNGLYYNKSVVMSKSGFPDVIVIVGYISYYFEVKYGNDSLSELQKYTIRKLNSGGKIIAFEVGSYKEFLETIKKIMRECKKNLTN